MYAYLQQYLSKQFQTITLKPSHQSVRGYYEFLYSKDAVNHDIKITPIKDQLLIIFISCNFKCPYHANVMKTFETINNNIVYKPFILHVNQQISMINDDTPQNKIRTLSSINTISNSRKMN